MAESHSLPAATLPCTTQSRATSRHNSYCSCVCTSCARCERRRERTYRRHGQGKWGKHKQQHTRCQHLFRTTIVCKLHRSIEEKQDFVFGLASKYVVHVEHKHYLSGVGDEPIQHFCLEDLGEDEGPGPTDASTAVHGCWEASEPALLALRLHSTEDRLKIRQRNLRHVLPNSGLDVEHSARVVGRDVASVGSDAELTDHAVSIYIRHTDQLDLNSTIRCNRPHAFRPVPASE